MKIASRATRDTPARIPPRSQVGLLTSRKRSERNRQAPPRHARPFLQLFGSARVSRRLFRKSRSRSTRPKLKRLLLGGAATDARTLRSVVRAYGYSTLNSVEQRRGGCSGRSRHPEGRGLFWALAAEGIPTTRPKWGLTCCSRSQEGGCGSPPASLPNKALVMVSASAEHTLSGDMPSNITVRRSAMPQSARSRWNCF
jgi:hypothetical protein